MTEYVARALTLFIAVLCVCVSPLIHAEDPATEVAASSDPQSASADGPRKPISNRRCMRCHGDEDEKTSTRPDGTVVNIFISQEEFENSVHGKELCVGCHNNIAKLPHDEPLVTRVGCIQCHREKWNEGKGRNDPQHARLGKVVEQIECYLKSVHARPNMLDQSKTNATCYDCHEAHSIGALGTQAQASRRLKDPEICGKCHEKQKAVYLQSVHGKELIERRNAKSATCSDCHISHTQDSAKLDAVKLLLTKSCGSCHEDSVKSYQAAYHGQVATLGYAHTAKCYDCHGGHEVKKVDDPTSMVHDNNRLVMCRKCHEAAPSNFLGFHSHGNINDFERYPDMWIAARLMLALLASVFLFFWTHVFMWLYREYQEQRERKGREPEVDLAGQVYFRRFSASWRLVHLVGAVSIMAMVLTGTAILFAEQPWAPWVMELLGGPRVAAIVHRVAASIFAVIFFGHLIIVGRNIYRNRKTFQWFGPTSLVPNLQDVRDIGAMFRWFVGKGPRPTFDRWTYWEKFDYWAPFWGMFVIGLSGLMLWFPVQTAQFLPGSVFNIATIVHAEEAVLAAVFLFSVHFFNAHFRPDKFPMDIVMFTGAVPLEEFKREHRLEYERLVAAGELEKYLVKPPSRRMTIQSKILGATLILIGLVLLALVLHGYVNLLQH